MLMNDHVKSAAQFEVDVTATVTSHVHCDVTVTLYMQGHGYCQIPPQLGLPIRRNSAFIGEVRRVFYVAIIS